jgi:ATP-dependent Clp protease ATP-binding subunit ClpA
MFERYTETARRAIFFARYEASQYGSPRIDTEHLVLALLRDSNWTPEVFPRDNSPREAIRKRVDATSVLREKISTSIDIPLSQECRDALTHGEQEADRLNHKYIDTLHLTFGILREEKSFGATLLQEQGVDAAAIESLLAKAPPAKAPPTPADKPLRDLEDRHQLLRVILGPAGQTECIEILMRAVEQAKTLQHDVVMPEHLLLAILLDSNSAAAQLLAQKGVTEEDIRRLLGKGDV